MFSFFYLSVEKAAPLELPTEEVSPVPFQDEGEDRDQEFEPIATPPEFENSPVYRREYEDFEGYKNPPLESRDSYFEESRGSRYDEESSQASNNIYDEMPRHRRRSESQDRYYDSRSASVSSRKRSKKSKKNKKEKKSRRRGRGGSSSSIYDNGSPLSSDDFDKGRERKHSDAISPISSADENSSFHQNNVGKKRPRTPPGEPPRAPRTPPGGPLVSYSRSPSRSPPRGRPRTPEGPPPPNHRAGDTPRTHDAAARTPEYVDDYRGRPNPATPPEPHPDVLDGYGGRPPSPPTSRGGPRTPEPRSPMHDRTKRRRTPSSRDPMDLGHSTPPKRRRSRERSPRDRRRDRYEDRRPPRSPRRRDSRDRSPPSRYLPPQSRGSYSRSPSPRSRYSRRSSRRGSPRDMRDMRDRSPEREDRYGRDFDYRRGGVGVGGSDRDYDRDRKKSYAKSTSLFEEMLKKKHLRDKIQQKGLKDRDPGNAPPPGQDPDYLSPRGANSYPSHHHNSQGPAEMNRRGKNSPFLEKSAEFE